MGNLSRKVFKKIGFSVAAGFAAFVILFYFFYFNSYYPYKLIFESNFNFASAVNPVQLSQKLSSPFSDLKGGTFYIDVVEVSSNGKIIFKGRYYSVLPASSNEHGDFLHEAVGEQLSLFLAENFCAVKIDSSREDILYELDQVNKDKLFCRMRFVNHVKREFQVSSFVLTDDGRLAKIFFISLVVSVFFTGFIYILLAGLNVLKND